MRDAISRCTEAMSKASLQWMFYKMKEKIKDNYTTILFWYLLQTIPYFKASRCTETTPASTEFWCSETRLARSFSRWLGREFCKILWDLSVPVYNSYPRVESINPIISCLQCKQLSWHVTCDVIFVANFYHFSYRSGNLVNRSFGNLLASGLHALSMSKVGEFHNVYKGGNTISFSCPSQNCAQQSEGRQTYLSQSVFCGNNFSVEQWGHCAVWRIMLNN